MSRTEFFTLVSLQDGLPLSLVQVAPEGEIRALVQLAHGMSEHKERYLPFMQFLAERGCLCVMNDHRGHGASVRSEAERGDPGAEGDIAMVEDMHQITLWLKQRHPGKRLILLGHSMGSLAVRAYCEDYAGEIDALGVVGCPGRNPLMGPGLMLTALMGALLGPEHRSAGLQGLIVGSFGRKFPQHPYAWLSVNRDNYLAFEGDPLCRFTYSIRGCRTLLKLMQRAYGLKHGRRDLPVRFYSGADDPCALGEKGFMRAMQAMKNAGFADVQGVMFPGMRHEILNETDKQLVFERIFAELIHPQM